MEDIDMSQRKKEPIDIYYSLSRLSALDVKWADLFDANAASFQRSHENPFYQLIVAVEGPIRIEAGNQRYTLQSGESLLLLPWERHTGWDRGERQGLFFWTQFSSNPELSLFNNTTVPDLNIVHMEKTELRTTANSHEDLLVIPKLHLSRRRFQLLELFEKLVSESNAPKGYFRFHQTLLLGEILRSIANDFLEQSHHDTTFPVSYITYRKLVNHLNNFFDKDVNRGSLEMNLDRKYEYLCQVFKKYSGTTIVQYVHQLQVQRAKHLLLSSDKTIGEIGEEVGILDSFYFSRIFKRFEGISPQHFRNQSQLPNA
jgi:AraC-like DNA-binding protein